MLRIPINELTPKGARLTGSLIGEKHAQQIAQRLRDNLPADGVVALDFEGIASASASYLKRLLSPLLATDGGVDDPFMAVTPVVVNASSADLVEELEDYLEGKSAVLQMAAEKNGAVRLDRMLGELEGAAAETFGELRKRGDVTAQELFEAQPNRTSNQTAWNNRLAQLVELKIARRQRAGRVWIYHTTISN